MELVPYLEKGVRFQAIVDSPQHASEILRGDVCEVVSKRDNRSISYIKVGGDGYRWGADIRSFYENFKLLGEKKMAQKVTKSSVGKQVIVLTDYPMDSCCRKGEIYTIDAIDNTNIHLDASRHRSDFDDVADSWVEISKQGRDWEFLDEGKVNKSLLDIIPMQQDKKAFNFAFTLSEAQLKEKLTHLGFSYNSTALGKILVMLNHDKDALMKNLDDFLFDEQYGYIYQAMEEVCGAAQHFVESDEDDDDDNYDDDDDSEYDDD